MQIDPMSIQTCRLWASFMKYNIPQTVSTVGVLVVYLLMAEGCGSNSRFYGDQLLCAGCGDRDGRVAPVYAKWSVISLSTEKHNGFGIFYFKSGLAPQMASGWPSCLPDASQMPLAEQI